MAQFRKKSLAAFVFLVGAVSVAIAESEEVKMELKEIDAARKTMIGANGGEALFTVGGDDTDSDYGKLEGSLSVSYLLSVVDSLGCEQRIGL